MPCGGIYPCDWPCFEPAVYCFHCRKTEPVPDHAVEEWDAAIHGGCVEEFLTREEGQIVLDHGHSVVVLRDGKLVTLHEEKHNRER